MAKEGVKDISRKMGKLQSVVFGVNSMEHSREAEYCQVVLVVVKDTDSL